MSKNENGAVAPPVVTPEVVPVTKSDLLKQLQEAEQKETYACLQALAQLADDRGFLIVGIPRWVQANGGWVMATDWGVRRKEA